MKLSKTIQLIALSELVLGLTILGFIIFLNLTDEAKAISEPANISKLEVVSRPLPGEMFVSQNTQIQLNIHSKDVDIESCRVSININDKYSAYSLKAGNMSVERKSSDKITLEPKITELWLANQLIGVTLYNCQNLAGELYEAQNLTFSTISGKSIPGTTKINDLNFKEDSITISGMSKPASKIKLTIE